MSDLARLAKPFARHLIHANPSGQGRGDYVAHSAITEKLLAVVGPFDFALVQILRGDYKDRPNVVVGAVCRLTVEVDGRRVSVEEVGDCENPGNWPHDGARMKDAMSDAIKRCAMRLGVGLHLWSQDEFFLFDVLSKKEGPLVVPAEASLAGVAQARAALDGSEPFE